MMGGQVCGPAWSVVNPIPGKSHLFHRGDLLTLASLLLVWFCDGACHRDLLKMIWIHSLSSSSPDITVSTL